MANKKILQRLVKIQKDADFKEVDDDKKILIVKRDYYEVLGVGRNSTPEELKKAFKKTSYKIPSR